MIGLSVFVLPVFAITSLLFGAVFAIVPFFIPLLAGVCLSAFYSIVQHWCIRRAALRLALLKE
jgi:predicted PurR-regulated permease PerM